MADYESQKKAELREEVDRRGLDVPSDARKDDLVAALEQDDATPTRRGRDRGNPGPGALPHDVPDDDAKGYFGHAPGADNDHTYAAEVKRLKAASEEG